MSFRDHCDHCGGPASAFDDEEDSALCWTCVAAFAPAHDTRRLRELTQWRYDADRLVLVHRATGYEVDPERCATAAQALDWVAQVTGKRWADPACIGELVIALDLLLGLQAHLCGSGVARRIRPAQVLHARHRELGLRWPRRHDPGRGAISPLPAG